MLETSGGELICLRPRFDQNYISQSRSVWITGANGFIAPGERHGLLVYQTRTISKYRYLIHGEEPRPAGLSSVRENSWLGYYTAPVKPGGNAIQDTIELRLGRFAGHGLHEEIDLVNHSQGETRFTLQLELDADFADQSEIGGEHRSAPGSLRCEWRKRGAAWELNFDFHAEHGYEHQGEQGVAQFHMELAVRIEHAGSEPSYSDGCISFEIELKPHQAWHACIDIIPTVEGRELQPAYPCDAFARGGVFDREREKFLTTGATYFSAPQSESLSSVVIRTITRASRDLAALRLHDLQHNSGWVPAAGTPEYLALFGRDALCASWQGSMLTTDMLTGALEVLGSLEGARTNDWRDEDPGKVLHQESTALVDRLNFTPFARYYGSLTSSGIYPFALAALWQWTGDKDVVRKFLDPALKAIRWRDEKGDLDGDGFCEYLTRSEGGLQNQGWKDSGDAMVHADGSQAKPPIAPCEEQGFTYLMKLRMAEMLWWIGEKDAARRFFRQARELKKRFNDRFWMPDERFFAMGLDRDKRPIRSISSNGGHVLETAIADAALAQAAADRLMESDLFNGWGVRTLSERHPAYNPFSYQRGAVWPAENGLFALGMLRYGLHHYAARICQAQFEAAALFEHNRLPELFAGQGRDAEHPFPGVYANANSPQAWSAAGVFCLLYSLLGIFPYAPLDTLFVDPHLPAWLPEITIENLRIGTALVSIRFRREKGGTSGYSVLDLRGRLHVVRQPSPWSLTATMGERFEDAISTLVHPGG